MKHRFNSATDVLSFNAMQGHATKIFWNQPVIAKILKRNRIETRYQLAQQFGLSRATVGRTFNDDWSGEATIPMLAVLSSALGVHPGRLIRDPREVDQ